MSKSVEEVRRAVFSKFFDGFQSTGEHCGVSIAESERELLELGFYAALDSICIELPVHADISASDSPHAVLADCRAAIEQTGLGLRVL